MFPTGRPWLVHLVVYFAWEEWRPEGITSMDSPDVVKGSLGWPGDGKGRGQGGLGRGMWCDIQEQAGSVTSRPPSSP